MTANHEWPSDEQVATLNRDARDVLASYGEPSPVDLKARVLTRLTLIPGLGRIFKPDRAPVVRRWIDGRIEVLVVSAPNVPVAESPHVSIGAKEWRMAGKFPLIPKSSLYLRVQDKPVQRVTTFKPDFDVYGESVIDDAKVSDVLEAERYLQQLRTQLAA